jgi:hypothetical protein
MNMITSSKYNNICISPDNWGNADPHNVLAVFESVVDEFHKVIDQKNYSTKKLFIRNTVEHPDKPQCPIYYKNETHDDIYIHTQDMYWCQYAYQFAHEFCHHLIQFTQQNPDKFGWLEETLCELASLFIMLKMAEAWKTHPPYPNWSSYSPSIADYVNKHSDKRQTTEESFDVWYQSKLNQLYAQRYDRKNNFEIAYRLLKVFNEEPRIWNSIFEFKNISFSDTTSVTEFLSTWCELLTEDNKILFYRLTNILNESTRS